MGELDLKINTACQHSKLTQADNFVGLEVNVDGQPGNVVGAFNWKKYICDECANIVTVLSAVVEKVEKEIENG